MNITLDTCVWLALLKDKFHADNSYFEELCFWIENGHVKHIVPSNMVDEWNRNKAEVQRSFVSEIERTDRNQILGFKNNPELSSTYDKDTIENRLQERISRVDHILMSLSEKAEYNEDIIQKAADLCLRKIAPNHQKDSFRDTVNILSLISYLRVNGYTDSIFTSLNYKDFSVSQAKKHTLHSELATMFEQAGLTYIYFDEESNFGGRFFSELRSRGLPSFQDHLQKEREKKNQAELLAKREATTAPPENPEHGFLDNIQYLDLILQKKVCTDFERDVLKILIGRHPSYRQYFFERVEGAAWFSFFQHEGFFDPAGNPETTPSREGYHAPFWQPLTYLRKLSILIKTGNAQELIPDVIQIIKAVSETRRDNFRTWYSLINILSNLPNKFITREILTYVPVWLSSKVDTQLQTSELLDNLLPKFLTDAGTKEDREKALVILKDVLAIRNNTKVSESAQTAKESYTINAHRFTISRSFRQPALLQKVAQSCCPELIDTLGKTLKLLLMDYPDGLELEITDNNERFVILITFQGDNLRLSAKHASTSINDSIIENYLHLDVDKFRERVTEIWKAQGVPYHPSKEIDDPLNRLVLMVYRDAFSMTGLTSVAKLEVRYAPNERLVNLYAVIFRDLLKEAVRLQTNQSLEQLRLYGLSKTFRLPFFKRVVLHAISQNWSVAGFLFLNLVEENDQFHLFSNLIYQKDVYELLNKNQHRLQPEEVALINSIIQQGKQGAGEITTNQNAYWQLGWYSALKEIEPFRTMYAERSQQLNVESSHFENLNEWRVEVGSTSPLNVEELQEMSNPEIADYIERFKPSGQWGEPREDGLADTLEKVIRNSPEQFTTDLDSFVHSKCIYLYHILEALTAAWKDNTNFHWSNALAFSVRILQREDFKPDTLGDRRSINPESVVGSVTRLLSAGLQHDENAFDVNLLPQAKEVLLLASKWIKVERDSTTIEMDYPTYSLNSLSGKVLRAVLDYSLRRARTTTPDENHPKWEAEVKGIFVESLRAGVVDSFILEGMYFSQFYYLDADWITTEVKSHYTVESEKWLPFMGGFVFNNAIYGKEYYELFYPHYERCIEQGVRFKHFHVNSIVTHITAFYFWQYETLAAKKLMHKFISQAPPAEVQELILFIGQQNNYPATLSSTELEAFRHSISTLWVFILDKYKDSTAEEEIKARTWLVNWVTFIPELNQFYTDLILKSTGNLDKVHATSELLEDLWVLRLKGIPAETAKYIGIIVLSINFWEYTGGPEEGFIKDIVVFLFEQGQREAAMQFCNRMASKNQMLFLREIYRKYTGDK